jgi:glutaconate CoA-transferase subunit B
MKEGRISVKEIQAAFISRDIKDGEWAEVGANLPVPRAGVLLAHLTHGPNMKILFSLTKANLINEKAIESFMFVTDHKATKWAEAYFVHDQLLRLNKLRRRGVFFAGGLQVDKYGNTNLIGIGKDYNRLTFRGPGGIGTCNATTHADRYYIFVNAHNTRTFVERCDFITTFGWGEGGEDARQKLGLPGGGPKYCITPLCIMDFEEKTKRMRLRSIYPSTTVEQVLENTAFELVIPKSVPITELPTDEEIRVLRSRIDIKGELRN